MPTDIQPSTGQSENTATCEHERQVTFLTAQYRHSTASVLAGKMAADEAMAACQTECGEASPFAGVDLHPITLAEAAAMMKPYSIFDEFTDMGRAAWDGLRRLLGRPDTTSKQAQQ